MFGEHRLEGIPDRLLYGCKAFLAAIHLQIE